MHDADRALLQAFEQEGLPVLLNVKMMQLQVMGPRQRKARYVSQAHGGRVAGNRLAPLEQGALLGGTSKRGTSWSK